MKNSSLLLIPFLLSSCVTITKTRDEKPVPLKFDQAKTAQTFYEGYFLPKSNTEFKPERGHVSLWLTLPFRYSRLDSPQKKLNAAIRTADTNKDGTLSRREVTAYQTPKK